MLRVLQAKALLAAPLRHTMRSHKLFHAPFQVCTKDVGATCAGSLCRAHTLPLTYVSAPSGRWRCRGPCGSPPGPSPHRIHCTTSGWAARAAGPPCSWRAAHGCMLACACAVHRPCTPCNPAAAHHVPSQAASQASTSLHDGHCSACACFSLDANPNHNLGQAHHQGGGRGRHGDDVEICSGLVLAAGAARLVGGRLVRGPHAPCLLSGCKVLRHSNVTFIHGALRALCTEPMAISTSRDNLWWCCPETLRDSSSSSG